MVLQPMFLSHWLACVCIGPHWHSYGADGLAIHCISKICASSLSFSSLSWCLVAHLLQKKWTDWVWQWFWVESSLLHAVACTAGRSWDSKSCDLESRENTMVALQCRAFWRFLKPIISFYNTDTIQLWSRCHAYATAVFFLKYLRRVNVRHRWRRDFLCHADSVFNFN